MNADWRSLREELRRWQDAGHDATFWWRDDDAQDATAQLDRLLCVAAALGVAPALAVVPAGATAALARRLREVPQIDVLQHGYAHANHAPAGEKTMELGAHRTLRTVSDELVAGRQRLTALAVACLPVVVPPWNRIDRCVLEQLGQYGFIGVSTFAPRDSAVDAQGLTHVNTHVDPIAWQTDRGFRGEAAALQQVLGHLSARRSGNADRQEPTGLLTHHLVQDDSCWEFCDRLITETQAFDNVTWVTARTLFGTD
ncbi:MAG: polysaccharide deacetylase family protein [Gammaproteobacteria bacterium]|nr:polysaccharide deacetylase family protein [Gammaproteobacteria bacterium]